MATENADKVGATDERAGTPLTYSLDDFLAGYRLKFRPSRRRWLVLIAFLGGVSASIPFLFEGLWLQLAVVVGVWVEIALIWAILFYLYVPWMVRREFARYPRLRDEFKFALEPNGVRMWSRNNVVDSLWSDFIGWRGNENILILYASPRIFHAFPARLEALGFPYRAFRAEVERNVPRRR